MNDQGYDPTKFGECPWCPDKLFKLAGNGLLQHLNMCANLRAKREREEAERAQNQLAYALHNAAMQARARAIGNVDLPVPAEEMAVPEDAAGQAAMGLDDAAAFEPEVDSMEDGDPQPSDSGSDDNTGKDVDTRPYILKTFHPRTGKPPEKIYLLDEDRNPALAPLPPPPDTRPFTYANFVFAERMVLTSASRPDINFLLRNLHDGTFAEGCKITWKTAKAMFKDLDEFAAKFTKFQKHTVSVVHRTPQGEDVRVSRHVYCRNLAEYLTQTMGDPDLAGMWEWHAFIQTLHRGGDAGPGESLVTSPMSAYNAWEMEGKIAGTGSYVQGSLTLYSDKSNAARFASVPIHPVSVRPASLDKSLVNTNGKFYSNSLLGFLPDLSTPPGEDCPNSNWPTTRRALFHASLQCMLSPIKNPSQTGMPVICGDGNERIVYPSIGNVTSDLDEEYVYACTRGNMANRPCPRCLVHRQYLADLAQESPMRNHETSRQAVDSINDFLANGHKECARKHMVKTGLYPVENAFWGIENTDVHQALSFDSLHTLYIGIFGSHIFPELIAGLSHVGKTTLMQRFDTAPAYPGLKRIYKIDALSFADGEKYFSVLQQILPYINDLLPPGLRPLVCLTEKLAGVIMHVKMKWQTSSRIQEGRDLIQSMIPDLELLKTSLPEKNFAFPKMHQLVHLFDDIIAKGTDEYLNCKVGENMHQGLIQYYAASNKKDFIEQICQAEARVLCLSRIRFRLTQYDVLQANHSQAVAQARLDNHCEEEDDDGGVVGGEDSMLGSEHEVVDEDARNAGPPVADRIAGLDLPKEAKARRTALQLLIGTSLAGREKRGFRNSIQITEKLGYYVTCSGRAQFCDFHLKLVAFGRYLARYYHRDLAPHQGMAEEDVTAALPVPTNDPFEIDVYHMIRHQVRSLDDEEAIADTIRCVPLAYGRPRHDTVLAAGGRGGTVQPARLHLVFEFAVHSMIWQAALISYFEALPLTSKDRDIGMIRYKESTEGVIVLLAVITRSCYMSPAANLGEFYLNPFVSGDPDLYIRVSEMYKELQ